MAPTRGCNHNGNLTYTINPDTNFVGGESCTWTIDDAKVSDQDSNDPPDYMTLDFNVGFTTFDVCAQPYTPIPAIQGSGATVALTGTGRPRAWWWATTKALRPRYAASSSRTRLATATLPLPTASLSSRAAMPTPSAWAMSCA